MPSQERAQNSPKCPVLIKQERKQDYCAHSLQSRCWFWFLFSAFSCSAFSSPSVLSAMKYGIICGLWNEESNGIVKKVEARTYLLLAIFQSCSGVCWMDLRLWSEGCLVLQHPPLLLAHIEVVWLSATPHSHPDHPPHLQAVVSDCRCALWIPAGLHILPYL